MGRHSPYESNPSRSNPSQNEIHPIWRGIGFVMMLIIPFLSYVGAMALLQENAKEHWVRIPADMLIRWGNDPMIGVKVLLTVLIAFALYLLFMMVTFMLNRVIAPPRYGPTDVPQATYRGKKSSR